MRRVVLVSVLGVLGLAAVAGGAGIAALTNKVQAAASPAAPVAPKAVVAKVGEPVQMGALTVTVTNVGQGPSVGAEWGGKGRAAEGGVLVGVKYSMKNSSAAPVKAFDVPRLQLVDAAGVIYSPDEGKTALYTADHPVDRKLLSDLNPGITVHDAAVFEVSAKAFDPATWSLQVGDGARVRLAKAG